MKHITIFLTLLISQSVFSQQTKKIQIPEPGIYMSWNANAVAQGASRFNLNTKQWDWKFGTDLEMTPSPFGNLEFKADGTYAFKNFNGSGTYRYDEKSHKIKFTGHMHAAEGIFSIQNGTCFLLISLTTSNGEVLTLQLEKKSSQQQGQATKPSGINFTGTIIASLTYNSVDYIDIASLKTVSSFSYSGYTKTGNGEKSIHIEDANKITYRETYPLIEIKDKTGDKITSFQGKSATGTEWAVGDYNYGVLSPDESKFILTGRHWENIGSGSYTYKGFTNPIFSVINISNGNEIKWFEGDFENKWPASWLPDGGLLMPRKNGGISITDGQFKNVKIIYSQKVNMARCSPDGKKILFAKGTQLYTINIDGSNEQQLTNKQVTISFDENEIGDISWSPDSKAIIITQKDAIFSNKYSAVFLSIDGQNFSYLKKSTGEKISLSWPTINWK